MPMEVWVHGTEMVSNRGRLIIGAYIIHIFVFIDRENNRLQKKLMMQITNI